MFFDDGSAGGDGEATERARRRAGEWSRNRQQVYENKVATLTMDKDQSEYWKAFNISWEKRYEDAEKARQAIWSLPHEEREKYSKESRRIEIHISERAHGPYDRRCASCAIDCRRDGRCPLPGKNPTQIIYEERCAPRGCAERQARGRCPRSCPYYVLTGYSQAVFHELDIGLIERLVAEGIDLRTWWPDEEVSDEFMSDP